MATVEIKSKIVKRWYISGKGFNSLMAACRFEARRQLKQKVAERASELYQARIGEGGDGEAQWQTAWRQAFGELFPPCENLGCCWDTRGYDYESEIARTFCVRARRAHIEDEARKLAGSYRANEGLRG